MMPKAGTVHSIAEGRLERLGYLSPLAYRARQLAAGSWAA
jgi:hypothetical protein